MTRIPYDLVHLGYYNNYADYTELILNGQLYLQLYCSFHYYDVLLREIIEACMNVDLPISRLRFKIIKIL